MIQFIKMSIDYGTTCIPTDFPFIMSMEQRARLRSIGDRLKSRRARSILPKKQRKSALYTGFTNPFDLKIMSAIINKMEKEQGDRTDWESYKWVVSDDSKFPYFITDFAHMTFLEVYEKDKEYVDFILKIRECTGFFKAFQDYCIIQNTK